MSHWKRERKGPIMQCFSIKTNCLLYRRFSLLGVVQPPNCQPECNSRRGSTVIKSKKKSKILGFVFQKIFCSLRLWEIQEVYTIWCLQWPHTDTITLVGRNDTILSFNEVEINGMAVSSSFLLDFKFVRVMKAQFFVANIESSLLFYF